MNAINKEKVFEKLRTYHAEAKGKFKGPQAESLQEEFDAMEDKIVSMVLSLVSGKAEFKDSSGELAEFEHKLREDAKKFFASKIEHLNEIMEVAKDSGFTLRPVRKAKITS